MAKVKAKNKQEFRPSFVPTTALAKEVKFADEMMQVLFADGRIISVPLIWFPLLQNATQAQREHFEIGGGGISLHWPEIDEDLSVASTQRRKYIA
jgi:hypothetical protein